MRWMFLAVPIIFFASLVGCNPSAPKDNPADKSKKSEDEIKQAFSSLQAAIKAKDVDKIWSLMAKDTQGDVEREGKVVKEAFAKLAESERAAYEKKVGLTAKEMTEMTGKLYVKSNTFFSGEITEMPDSKLEKVTVTGEATATVKYKEPGDKGEIETRSAVREDGQWKFVLEFTKAVLPDSTAGLPDAKTVLKIEQEVKQGFAALQSAVKAKDVDKIWSLLAKDARDDTERYGKATQEAFAKLPEKDKSAYEKKVGLSAGELANVTGKLYVKSSTFYTRKTGELTDSKLEKVAVTGAATATVHYEESDGDKVILSAVREDSQWKFVLHVTKAVLK